MYVYVYVHVYVNVFVNVYVYVYIYIYIYVYIFIYVFIYLFIDYIYLCLYIITYQDYVYIYTHVIDQTYLNVLCVYTISDHMRVTEFKKKNVGNNWTGTQPVLSFRRRFPSGPGPGNPHGLMYLKKSPAMYYPWLSSPHHCLQRWCNVPLLPVIPPWPFCCGL